MVVATLGNVIFEVYDGKIFTPKGISGSTGSDWATHDVVHGKTTREWIGPKAMKYSFEVLLRAQDGVPPRRTLDQLQAMAESNNAFWFVVGGQTVGKNPFVLTEISEEWGATLQDGRLIACTVSLTLEEYR